MVENPQGVLKVAELEILQFPSDVLHKTRAQQQHPTFISDLVHGLQKRDMGVEFHQPINARAFSKAWGMPPGSLPPAVAKKGCPPPPPWMSLPNSRTMLPACSCFSPTSSLEI